MRVIRQNQTASDVHDMKKSQLFEAAGAPRKLAAYGEDWAGGMRNDVVRCVPLEMSRCVEVACGVTDTEHDQVCAALFGGFDNSLSGIAVLDGDFRRAPKLRVLGHRFMKMVNRLGDREFIDPIVSVMVAQANDMHQEQAGLILLSQ